MIAPTPFFSDRGCHMRVLNSYFRLKRSNFNIDLLTYPIGRDMKGVNIKRTANLPGYRKTEVGFSIYKPFIDLFLLFRSIKEMRNNDYDIIYAHLHEGAMIGLVLKKLFNKELIFDSQGSLVGELSEQGAIKKQGMISKLVWPVEKYITKKPDKIITSTQALQEFITREIKPDKPIEVIEDYPDVSLFNPKVKKANLKLPKNKKIVVYLGGLQEYKGIDYLIKSIPYVNDKFHFLIMGYPVERVKELAKELNIEKRITFTGKIPYEKAPSYLKLGHIAVSPKTLESGEANAKVYNYLAMNLPVVCFDSKDNRRILKNKGIYAKPKDIKDLAKKIEEGVR